MSSAAASGASASSSSSISSSARPSLPRASNAYAVFSRHWILPGTLIGTAIGTTFGSTLGGWYHRNLWKASWNVGSKFGLASGLYFVTLDGLSRASYGPTPDQRYITHLVSGAISGTLLGGIVGRNQGAMRGAVIGAVLATPIWFALEGRFKLAKLIAGTGAGEEVIITEKETIPTSATQQQQQKSNTR